MSDPRELLQRYLEQRSAIGESPMVLDRRSPETGRPPAARSTPRQPTRPAAAEPIDRRPPAAPRRSKATAKGGSDARWKRDAPTIPSRGIVVPTPSTDLFSEDPRAGLDLDGVARAVHACTACVLCEHRTHAVPGEGPGTARLVVVGEGPGATEDETGRPFVGRAGELLTEILAAIDLPRERVFICNVVKCRPPNNRKPQQDEMGSCVPFLFRQLEIIRPAVILAMGGTAAETLLKTRQSLGALRNKVHEFRGTPLVVTYHPAALLRNPHWKKPTWDDVRIARQLVDRHA